MSCAYHGQHFSPLLSLIQFYITSFISFFKYTNNLRLSRTELMLRAAVAKGDKQSLVTLLLAAVMGMALVAEVSE